VNQKVIINKGALLLLLINYYSSRDPIVEISQYKKAWDRR
jgi:hypothetical protein